MNKLDFARIFFILACGLVLFSLGLSIGIYKIFPYQIIVNASKTIEQVFGEKDTLLGLRPSEFLEQARFEGSGVTRLDSDHVVPGLTFLAGFMGDGNEMRLITADGSIVNRWPIKYFDIFPEPDFILPSKNIPKSEWNVAVHGTQLLPDGSVVFNFTYRGAAKIDRCGNLMWTIPRMTHHAIARASDGGFWFPTARYVEGPTQDPSLPTPYREDTILKVSADGVITGEISILEILRANNLLGHVYWKAWFKGTSADITHMNDVEELTAEMAVDFARFDAGDLLISLRFQDMVMVVDPKTLEVKWHQRGPWLGQHDPDFMDGGRISVFSNNNDRTEDGSRFGGSGIIEIDPTDQSIQLRYGARSGEVMYTTDRGKHQRIGEDDRGILITESRAGRIFEVNQAGEVVWEYINRYDDAHVTVMTGATRYPEDYFTVTDWSCP